MIHYKQQRKETKLTNDIEHVLNFILSRNIYTYIHTIGKTQNTNEFKCQYVF